MAQMNCCISANMLRFRCCLHVGYTSRSLKTFGSNLWRPKCSPSPSNIEFFIKSWYRQDSIGYKWVLTITTTFSIPTHARILVLALHIHRAAFNNVKPKPIFYFPSKKQQHSELLPVFTSQRNGQERI